MFYQMRQVWRAWARELRLARSRAAIQALDFRSGLGQSAWLLYGLTRSIRPQVCVEIGSARGKSACAIGYALRENRQGHLWAIDPHQPTNWNDSESVQSFDIIRRHLRQTGVEKQVTIVRSTSVAAAATWERKIDLLFIDGDHSYDGIKRDWELFVPHVNEFGVVVFHDSLWNRRDYISKGCRDDMGVPRFLEELRLAQYPLLTISQDFGVTLVQPRPGGVTLVN